MPYNAARVVPPPLRPLWAGGGSCFLPIGSARLQGTLNDVIRNASLLSAQAA
jgi:hypothetical protein